MAAAAAAAAVGAAAAAVMMMIRFTVYLRIQTVMQDLTINIIMSLGRFGL